MVMGQGSSFLMIKASILQGPLLSLNPVIFLRYSAQETGPVSLVRHLSALLVAVAALRAADLARQMPTYTSPTSPKRPCTPGNPDGILRQVAALFAPTLECTLDATAHSVTRGQVIALVQKAKREGSDKESDVACFQRVLQASPLLQEHILNSDKG